MRSNYKRIGDFIRQVKVKNTDNSFDLLLGINIDKYFMPSVANIVGTDLSKYKVVKPGQFACNRMHVGRDYRLPIAHSKYKYDFIVSPAYDVFEIVDESILFPEYLMMWFSRKEFDRNTWFHTDADVRGGLPWKLFCELQLPVPSIQKQREIVKEYNTIVNRIKLNEQLNQKLEETAQAIYKHWFVDFDFPDEKGKPYKLSGGKMMWNEELEKEIPVGWNNLALGQLCNCNISNYGKENTFAEIRYLDTSNLTENKFDKIQVLKIGDRAIPSRAKRIVSHNDIVYSTVRPNLRHYGLIKYPTENMIVSTGFAVLSVKSDQYCAELIYQSLIHDKVVNDLQAKAEMSVSTYPSIKPKDLLALKVALPIDDANNIDEMNTFLSATYELIFFSNKEIGSLYGLKDLALSKMTKL